MKKTIVVLCGLSGMISWLPLHGVASMSVGSGDAPAVPTRTVGDSVGDNAGADDQVKFAKTAASRTQKGNALFLGAEMTGANKQDFAIAKATAPAIDMTTGKPTVAFSPLAPAMTKLNGVDQANPLDGAKIAQLALLNNSLPAAVVDGAKEVYLITDTDKGLTTLKTAMDAIHDAADAAIDTPAVALAASSDTIFAAVPQMGKTFGEDGGDDRGIAVIKQEGVALVPKDVTDLTMPAGAAAKLSAQIADSSKFAFVDGGAANKIVKAFLNDEASMHWNDNLGQLYIGLQNVKRDAVANEGGVLTIVRGVFDNPAAPTQFGLESIIDNPDKAQFYKAATLSENVSDAIVGFYYDNVMGTDGMRINPGNDDFDLSTGIIRSMFTSTEKDYLIVNGMRPGTNVEIGGLSTAVAAANNVYALPLLGENPNTGTPGALSKVVAGVATFDDAPAALADMPRETQAPVKVGGQDLPLRGDFLKDIFVEGDSVYACRASDAAMNAAMDVGIFHSTALFNQDGSIIAWTPEQRVMGHLDRTLGALYDNTTGGYLYLTDHPQAGKRSGFDINNLGITSDFDTVNYTQWGKGDGLTDAGSLNAVLSALFPLEQGGVHQIFTFNERTPGFAADSFSAMVAVGLDRIALIQTGKITNAQFEPTPLYDATVGSPTQNVFVFEGAALGDIGPVCTAEFARSTGANEGWLFVGGYNGVSVLRTAAGAGFASSGGGLAGLSGTAGAGNYPGNTFTFKKLTPTNNVPFDHVRKLTSLRFGAGASDTRLYVMTDKNVAMVTMSVNKFQNVPVALGETLIVDVTNAAFPAGTRFTDFVPVVGQSGVNGFRAFLATSKGLFLLARDGGADSITEVPIADATGQPVVQLQYLSTTKAGPSAIGNLVVLAADMSQAITTGKVYRFFVDAGQAPANTVASVAGSVVDFSEFRGNIFTDGSIILNARAKHFDDTNYLNMVAYDQATSMLLNYQLTPLQDVDVTQNTLVGSPIRETASGALIVPGDWGVRVNE